MEILFTYACLFMMGSLGGWISELFYRRFFSAHKWVNPGFLTGPCLPIYGFGVCLMYLFCNIDYSFITTNEIWLYVIKILICGFMMTFIEYVGGIVFIKWMNIKLWDYTKRWGNIQGVICPLFTAIWLVASAAYLFLVNDSLVKFSSWITENIVYLEFFVGVFYGIAIIDTILSFDLSHKIKKFAKEHNIVVAYEDLKLHIRDKAHELKTYNSFVLPFKTRVLSLSDVISSYSEKVKKELDEIKLKKEERKQKKSEKNEE